MTFCLGQAPENNEQPGPVLQAGDQIQLLVAFPIHRGALGEIAQSKFELAGLSGEYSNLIVSGKSASGENALTTASAVVVPAMLDGVTPILRG